MSDQLTLPITPLPKDGDRTLTIQERFEIFDRLNPHVYLRLVAMARSLKAKGHRRVGINMLWEVLRWNYYEQTTDPSSGYHLNDHYPSRYARKIVASEPDIANLFETRRLKSE